MSRSKTKFDAAAIPLPDSNPTQAMWWARDQLRHDLATGAIVGCPCCGGAAKVYARKINMQMIKALIVLGRNSKGMPPSLLMRLADVQGGDYGKLRHYGFVREDNEPERGIVWYVTQRGIAFLRGDIQVPHRMILYQNKCLGFDDSKMVRVTDIHPDFSLARDVFAWEDPACVAPAI